MDLKTPRHRDVHSPYETQVLVEAEALCGRALAAGSQDPQLLYLAGRLAALRGLDDSACAYLKLAAALRRPSLPDWYVALGDVLVRRSPAEAIAAYLKAIVLDRDSPVAYTRLASALVGAAHLLEAVAVNLWAIRLQPHDAALHRALGEVFEHLGRPDASIRAFDQTVKCDPFDAAGYIRLGVAHLTHGDPTMSLASFQHALRLTNNPALIRDALQTSIGDAPIDYLIEVFRWALTRDKSDTRALSLLVDVLDSFDRPRDATEVRLALGVALIQQRRHREASMVYRRVAADAPRCLRATLGAARASLAGGVPNQAIPFLRRALAQHPDHDSARAGLGEALHLTGAVDEGWDAFAPHYSRGESGRAFEQPVWDGSPLQGKRILLWASHGRGDVIQFLRYVRCAHEAGGRVLIECNHKSLLPLIERMDHVEQVIASGAPLPAFDVHAPLMCFPAVVPSSRNHYWIDTPYLSVDPHRVAFWKERLKSHGTKRTVGLSWGGYVAHEDADSRFLPLAAFLPLGSLAGIRLVSLQHGPQTAELLNLPSGLRVARLFGESFPIIEAAALILALDLVITVDTMIAHLAGALGRPVWTLLRFASNWRWQMHGDRTPWYPTMRLFRQTQSNDWNTLMEPLRKALQAHDWNAVTDITSLSVPNLPLPHALRHCDVGGGPASG